MGYLRGLREYLIEHDGVSVFDDAVASGQPWVIHLCGHRVVQGRITACEPYEITLEYDDGGRPPEVVDKLQIKFLYTPEWTDAVRKLLKKGDPSVEALGLEPTLSPRLRHYVKNKSLYPLMQEKTVVFVTLLEGEVIRGLITGFSRYELSISMKRGVPVTVMRHAIYELKDKEGRSYLKAVQEKRKDWKRSSLWVEGAASKS